MLFVKYYFHLNLSKKIMNFLFLIILISSLGFLTIGSINFPIIKTIQPLNNNNPLNFKTQSFAKHKDFIVICVEFSNRPASTNPSSIMSKISKMEDYYNEISYGLLNISGTLAVPSGYDPDGDGWYNVGKYDVYYNFSNSVGSRDFLKRVYTVADPDVYFAKYKYIMIICAGNDMAQSYNPNDLHSHFISFSPGIIKDLRSITNSTITAELDPFSVYCHEFGHALGLPDLYDIDNDGINEYFVGRYALMAQGSWNGGGQVPAGMMGFSRMNLSILDVSATVLNNTHKQVKLYSLSETNNSALIKIPITGSKYYLIDYRKKVETDRALPDQGVIISYVDESKGSHWNGTVMWQKNGPVRIQDAHPLTSGVNGLDDAPFDIGINEISYFNDNTNNVHIVLLQKNGSDYYTIDIDRTNSTTDLTPPTTDVVVNGWYSGNTIFMGSIQLAPYDFKSGINKTYYRINNGPWQNYNKYIIPPFSFLPTTYLIEYYSTDNNGNIESIKSVSITMNNIFLLLIIGLIIGLVIFLIIYKLSKSKKK